MSQEIIDISDIEKHIQKAINLLNNHLQTENTDQINLVLQEKLRPLENVCTLYSQWVCNQLVAKYNYYDQAFTASPIVVDTTPFVDLLFEKSVYLRQKKLTIIFDNTTNAQINELWWIILLMFWYRTAPLYLDSCSDVFIAVIRICDRKLFDLSVQRDQKPAMFIYDARSTFEQLFEHTKTQCNYMSQTLLPSVFDIELEQDSDYKSQITKFQDTYQKKCQHLEDTLSCGIRVFCDSKIGTDSFNLEHIFLASFMFYVLKTNYETAISVMKGENDILERFCKFSLPRNSKDVLVALSEHLSVINGGIDSVTFDSSDSDSSDSDSSDSDSSDSETSSESEVNMAEDYQTNYKEPNSNWTFWSRQGFGKIQIRSNRDYEEQMAVKIRVKNCKPNSYCLVDSNFFLFPVSDETYVEALVEELKNESEEMYTLILNEFGEDVFMGKFRITPKCRLEAFLKDSGIEEGFKRHMMENIFALISSCHSKLQLAHMNLSEHCIVMCQNDKNVWYPAVINWEKSKFFEPDQDNQYDDIIRLYYICFKYRSSFGINDQTSYNQFIKQPLKLENTTYYKEWWDIATRSNTVEDFVDNLFDT